MKTVLELVAALAVQLVLPAVMLAAMAAIGTSIFDKIAARVPQNTRRRHRGKTHPQA